MHMQRLLKQDVSIFRMASPADKRSRCSLLIITFKSVSRSQVQGWWLRGVSQKTVHLEKGRQGTGACPRGSQLFQSLNTDI
jgi:hypothetical protein